ncbi:nitrous oxide reductase family maturation protein NosD [Sneathiella sp. P13V-1]|uniref:nitrous oxide reductase family maturation protein NosD n=1 Tax=Sneathiella sp. P13V-1 TaxID=2697366 RepID=UPI00187B9254|nr:nitrous oxide reductase family maturation protein NosD [Sneathiella sp. P13V-1]MBE7635916.1 nitrous oxide reductase family maturation protein NosD [Sneathiella sp. P13V-1]
MTKRPGNLWRGKWGAAAVFAVALLLTPNIALSKSVIVDGSLTTALHEAADGDILRLKQGVYEGPFVIDKSIKIIGDRGVTLKGHDQGTVVRVLAPNVTLKNLKITGSGISLAEQNSGIFLDKTAENAVVENNQVENNLIGIYVSGAKNSMVRNNHIIGRQDLRINERGNGIQIWNAPGTIIEKNTIEFGRDGIFVTTSKKNIFRGNILKNLRFAIHYMYTNRSEVSDNISIGNHIGYALMSSTHLKVKNNLSSGDRDRGFLFNYTNRVKMTENVVRGGPEKCIFIYNSNKNEFTENVLSDCLIGIHFTAGSERNVISGNAFVGNQTQVKYVGTRWLEWSKDGVGNHWSDHVAFDLDKNGVADSVYRPNDLTDQIIWKYPSARLLMNSPAVQVLKYAQSNFPALHPGGVVDSAPLMQMPEKLAKKAQK